jgi:hypothetical protein
MDNLFFLPNDILEYCIFPLLTIHDLSALDVAVCSHELRPLLLEVYPQLRSVQHTVSGLTRAEMAWFVSRFIPLESICLPTRIETDDITAIFDMLQHSPVSGQVRDISFNDHFLYTTTLPCSQLLDACPGLVSLNIAFLHGITKPIIVRLCLGLLELQTLDLSGCPRLTTAAVIALSKGCHSLTSLNLSYHGSMSDAAVIALSQGCLLLIDLNLNYCHNLTNAAIVALSHGCPSLTRINLSECNNISCVAMVALSQGCLSLASLDITYCTRISNESLVALSQRLPSILISSSYLYL